MVLRACAKAVNNCISSGQTKEHGVVSDMTDLVQLKTTSIWNFNAA